MTEPIRPAGADVAQPRKLLFAAALSLGVMFLCLASPSAAEQLLLGWLYFPARVLPHVTADLPTLVLGLICVCVTVLFMHQTLKWLLRTRSSGQPQRWSVRATLIITSFLLLLFVAGTAMVGATHQSVWLMTGSLDRARRVNQTAPVTGLVQELEQSATRTRVRNQFHQIGLGMHNFHDVHGALPYGGAMDDHGRQLHGWIVQLAPYLIYSYEGIDFSQPWNSPPNDGFYRCALPDVLHPSIPDVFDERGFGLSHIAGNVHVLPMIAVPHGESVEPYDLERRNRDAETPASPLEVSLEDIRDGAANTILAGEVVENFRPWGHPANVREPALGVNRSPDGFGCLPGEPGALFLMCDGSLRTVSPDVDDTVMRALATPAGDEPVSDEF